MQIELHTFQLFSALTVLFLFLFLMFFLNTEQGVHIGFDRLQLLIFFSQPFVIFVGGFLLCQQIGILRLQNFDRGQLLHALGVKGPLRRLMEKQIRFVSGMESRFVCRLGLAVGNIGIPCFGVVDNMGFESRYLLHAVFHLLDGSGYCFKVSRYCFSPFRKNIVLRNTMLGKVVQGLGRFLQIVYLHPAFQAGATTLQAGLNVHKQIDLAVHVQIDFLPLGQLRFADPLLQSFQCIISAQCFGTGKAFLTLGTEFQYLLTLDNLVTFCLLYTSKKISNFSDAH